MNLDVRSELGRLREVVVHRPGPELDLMTPENIRAYLPGPRGRIAENRDYLLFDDLVLLSRLRAEHEQIVDVLRAACGREHVHELPNLLRAMLHDGEARAALVDEVVGQERDVWGAKVPDGDRRALLELDPHSFLHVLVRGRVGDGRQVLKWPLPNLMFTRDLAAVVGSDVLLSYARKPARRREMLIVRALFRFLPAIAPGTCIDIGDGLVDPALEGGDVLVLSPDVVAIGAGERTTVESAMAAAELLVKRSASVVHVVTLKDTRSTMHLDTIFTLVDHGTCLAYSPHVMTPGALHVTTVERGGGRRERTETLLDVLAGDGLALEPIACGGDDPVHQAREQWSDGANAFALAPGKILLYGRNERTLQRLNEAGFEVLTPPEFCRNASLLLGDASRRVVVAIDGAELSRGRGGPRCLTMPLRRD